MPATLATLWKSVDAKDPFVAETLAIELLTSLDILEESYPSKLVDSVPNVRAHRKVFERLGFFARGDDAELFAFDFGSGPADDPPVVKLDTEGEYRWKGQNLVEALVRLAEDRDAGDESRKWLAAHGLKAGDYGDSGSTTQFLPAIGELQADLYWEYAAKPRVQRPTVERDPDPNDPCSWILCPASKVRAAIGRLLKLPPGSKPNEHCVWCDGAGRVIQAAIPKTRGTADFALRGIRFGMSEAQVSTLLGTPTDENKDFGWAIWESDGIGLRVGFKDSVVHEISVGLSKG